MRAQNLVLLTFALLLCATSPAAAAGFDARGSIDQAWVVGARSGERVTLLDRTGRTVRASRADRLGSKIFRDVRPGSGYRIRTARRTSRPFAVLRKGQNPPAAFYRGKRLKAGLNYVKMRDGIELAMTVRLPPGKTLADGPFPTVIEHSGYQTAAPKDLLSSVVTSVTGGQPKTDPLAPASSTIVGSAITPLLGFATVSVQMRGSGCSGGAFDLFDLPTTYDGYDMVETVAAQRWVKGRKVGMVGISFSGITQLFTAGTRPPHLAAISPMSVTDDTYRATGYPGGIRNKGFAESWIADRMEDAEVAPAGGQPWARILAKTDRNCRLNQRLRLQTENAVAISRRTRFRSPERFADRSGAEWMRTIDVPTYFVGAFQDEQTGGHFARSLKYLNGNDKVWISLLNGVHVDSLGPDTITRWVEFLKLYVADEVPEIPQPILDLSGALYNLLAEAPSSPVLQSRFAGMTDVAAARATFERDPRVRLLMENGAGPAGAGAIGSSWELGFDAWPIREAPATDFFLAPGGSLVTTRPQSTSTVEYTADPKARPAQSLAGTDEGAAWKAQPPYEWKPVAAGKGVGFATPPLERDLVIAGSSSLDVYLRSTARDTDLQVTLSEIRPDGRETYVQNGWLRASHRKLDARESSALDPVPTHLRKDAAPLSSTDYALVRVPIFPVAHAFRAGSRLRVTIQAPGGDRPRWRFETVDKGRTRNTIAVGFPQASKLVLPVVTGATAATPLPAPTALRGQPSREYRSATNGG